MNYLKKNDTMKDIAIIGASARIPQGDDFLEILNILKEGRDCIAPISKERLKKTGVQTGLDYVEMGYLEEIDVFDHQFFKISKAEAVNMDPTQRILIQSVYHALENTGYTTSYFQGTNTSVLVGDVNLQYYRFAEKFEETLFTGNLNSTCAGNIARLFDLRGRAMMVDTACSSGLVALYEGCRDIQTGDSNLAVVSGIDLTIFPSMKVQDMKLGIEAEDGRCRTFSDDATGTGAGEAVVAFVLKSYEEAEKDGDHIYGIIKGAAVNQDAGRSASLTAPDADAQKEVLLKAWERAQIKPDQISFIECHGTGTKLGDPIEIDGINKAFKEAGKIPEKCDISSVKTNIGHTNGAAGLVGVLKVLLAFKSKHLFPSVHFSSPNKMIDFDASNLSVTTQLKEWNSNRTRIAGVSSFGIIGTNCHVVLSEAPELSIQEEALSNFVISSKDEEGITRYKELLTSYLEKKNEVSLNQIGATLLSNRAGNKYYASWRATDRASFLKNMEEALPKKRLNQEFPVFFILDHFSGMENIPKWAVTRVCERMGIEEKEFLALFQRPLDLQFIFHWLLIKEIIESTNLKLNILPLGNGGVLNAYLNEELTLNEALKELKESFNAEGVKERLNNFVARFNEEQYFLSLDQKAEGTTIVREIASDNVHLIALKETSELSQFFSELVAEGAQVDWKSLPWTKKQSLCYDLPGYPFNKTRCWMVPEKEVLMDATTAMVKDWLYTLGDKEIVDVSDREVKEKNILILGTEKQKIEEVAEELSQDNTVIKVVLSYAFETLEQDKYYRIDATKILDYQDLEQELMLADFTPDYVLSLFELNDSFNQKMPIDGSLNKYIYPIVHFSRSMHFTLQEAKVEWLNIRYSTNDTNSNYPIQKAQDAALKSVGVEYSKCIVKSLQIDETNNLAKVVKEAIEVKLPVRFATYKAKKWWGTNIVKSELNTQKNRTNKNGVHLVTGGAGGIGFEVSKYLLKEGVKDLVVLGRTEENATSPRGEELRSNLKELRSYTNSVVEYHALDVQDKKAIEALKAELLQRDKKVDTVYHIAGLKGSWEPIIRKEMTDFRKTLTPKVDGVLNIENSFLPRKQVLFSSLNSVIPQPNSADYAVANGFIDGWVKCDPENRLAINWPGWLEVGMVKNLDSNKGPLKSLKTVEGLKALDLALTSDQPSVLVAEVDFSILKNNPYFLIDSTLLKEEAVVEEVNSKEETTQVHRTDWTNEQNKMWSIWNEVLQLEEIDLDDDFFELGGHSLLGSKVINRIEDVFGVVMEFEDIYEYATIRALVDYVNDQEREVNNKEVEDIVKVIPEMQDSKYPLSFQQKGIWSSYLLHGKNNFYNIPYAFNLPERIDVKLLNGAINHLIKHQEQLRVTFHGTETDVYQLVHNDKSFETEELSIEGEKEQDKLLTSELEKLSDYQFELTEWPLFQVKVYHLNEHKSCLMVNFNHIICDALSMTKVFFPKLMEAYQVLSQGEGLEAPTNSLGYRNYVLNQYQGAAGNAWEEHKVYWTSKFKGEITQDYLPYDFERPAFHAYEGDTVVLQIDQKKTDQLNELAKRKGVTLYFMNLAVFYALFRRMSRKDFISFGSSISNRDTVDYEDVIGLFAGILLLGQEVQETDTIETLIDKTKSSTLDSFRHKEYPAEKIIEDLEIPVEPNRYPLFDLNFIWHNVSIDRVEAVREEEYSTRGIVKFDMEIHGMDIEDGMLFYFGYNDKLFKRESIQKMADLYELILDQFISDQQTQINDLVLEETQTETTTQDVSDMFDF